jgi:SAM-dependent methyltransferase
VSVFDTALRRAAAGRPASFSLRNEGGGVQEFDPAAWCRDDLPGDRGLLDRCAGPTVDVGCGPGRLAGALARSGIPALGIDVSATAVRLTRRRGALALRRSIFDPLPGTGRWQHLLLADGNIGIGGDPVLLLRRCRDLLAPDGRVHAELAPPGTPTWAGMATVQAGPGDGGVSLPWAAVAVDALPALAGAAALHTAELWTEANRWFATLTA